jgi:hypothetical protein
MATGIATTTVQTSLHVLMACVHYFRAVFVNRLQPNNISLAFRELGLQAKAIFHTRLDQATFLRGWWLGPVWAPLPSMVLKLGKVITAPRIIARTKDAQLAIQRVARALAMCYNNIPANYPIVGPFIAMLARLGKDGPVTAEQAVESWAFKAKGGAFICPAGVYDSLRERYGITPLDCEEVERLCESVTSLPVFMSHHVFVVLMQRDY